MISEKHLYISYTNGKIPCGYMNKIIQMKDIQMILIAFGGCEKHIEQIEINSLWCG